MCWVFDQVNFHNILSKLTSVWFHFNNEIGMGMIFENPWLTIEEKVIV